MVLWGQCIWRLLCCQQVSHNRTDQRHFCTSLTLRSCGLDTLSIFSHVAFSCGVYGSRCFRRANVQPWNDLSWSFKVGLWSSSISSVMDSWEYFLCFYWQIFLVALATFLVMAFVDVNGWGWPWSTLWSGLSLMISMSCCIIFACFTFYCTLPDNPCSNSFGNCDNWCVVIFIDDWNFTVGGEMMCGSCEVDEVLAVTVLLYCWIEVTTVEGIRYPYSPPGWALVYECLCPKGT